MKPLLLLPLFLFLIKDPCVAQNCQASFTWVQTGPNTITFTNTSTGTNMNTVYNYSFGDSQYGFTANTSHTYANSGIYMVCLVIYDSALCQSSFCDTVIVQNTQGITDQTASVKDVFIFPNPAQSQASLELSLTQNTDLTVSVFDLSGKEVMLVANGDHAAGKHQFNLPCSSLESGLYMIRIREGNNTLTKKLSVLH